MSKRISTLATLTVSLLAGSAIAQTGNPPADDWLGGGAWYLGAKVGGNWMANDSHITGYAPYGVQSGHVQYDDGYIGALEGGFAMNNGLRLELEGSYRYNQVNGVSPFGAGRGVMRNYAAMTNALYELPIDFPLHPYVGAGVGAADYAPDHIRGDGEVYPGYVSGDRWGFAWQAIGGVSYDLDPNLALTLEYRYFERVGDHPVGVNNDYETHSALVGLRYTFGEPAVQEAVAQTYTPPPPAPRPAAAPHSYLVFFDFNKSDLTADARHVVDQAAGNAKTTGVTRLEVTGYTDTVGSDAYNMRLSRRRAESVSSELQAQGVPSSDIAIFAKGKHDLLVPTADGVREPQNRRVQIIYGNGGPPPTT